MTIRQAELVEIYPCKIWSEKDIFGTVHIKMQHQGDDEPFTFVQIHYDYAYTSNSHQWRITQEILKLLGVEENKE